MSLTLMDIKAINLQCFMSSIWLSTNDILFMIYFDVSNNRKSYIPIQSYNSKRNQKKNEKSALEPCLSYT